MSLIGRLCVVFFPCSKEVRLKAFGGSLMHITKANNGFGW